MVNPAVCGSELAGVDDRTVFEFDPAVLNETSFSYDDFLFHCIQVTAQGPQKDHLVDIYDVRTDSTEKRGKGLIKAVY